MKTDNYKSILIPALNNFKTIDRNKLYREYLGVKSLREEIEPLIKDIEKKLTMVSDNMGKIEDDYAQNLINAANLLLGNLNEYAKANDNDFMTNRGSYIVQLKKQYKNFLDYWHNVAVEILFGTGILERSSDIERASTEIERKLNEAQDKIKSITDEVINVAKEQAGEIKKSAQKTARNISVKAAQEQFSEATKNLKNQIILWGIISVLIIVTFIILAVNFYKETLMTPDLVTQIETYKEHFIDIYRWNSIYHAIIRVTILAVVAAVATFSLKILRANMHMYQHNLHRKRVANSIEAFVNAAMSDEQSDMILTHLVEAVVQFGNSGLIQKEDDNIHASKMTIDNITRYFTTSSKTS